MMEPRWGFAIGFGFTLAHEIEINPAFAKIFHLDLP